MNIDGMGPEIIDLLYANKFVKSFSDIYSLPSVSEKLVGLEKVGIPEVFEVPKIPLERVIYAFKIGYNEITLNNSFAISEKYKSLKKYSEANIKDLISLETLKENSNNPKEKIARKIVDYFSNPIRNEFLSNFGEDILSENGISLKSILMVLNIPFLTERDLDLLINNLDFIYTISKCSFDDYVSIGLDDNKAMALTQFFRSSKNQNTINKLNTLSKTSLQRKSVENLLKSIEESKSQEFSRVLYALGIRYVGENVAKILANEFKSIDVIKSSTIETFTDVDDIGPNIANSLINYFSDPKHIEEIKKLESYGLNFELAEEELKDKNDSKILKGLSFLVTGTLPNLKRDEVKNKIEINGGKFVSSISSKTDYLILGENPGSKLQKAKKIGTKIISEDEFLNIINKEQK